MLQRRQKVLAKAPSTRAQSGHSILRIVAGSKSCATRRQHGH
jgi:hypothetical protein